MIVNSNGEKVSAKEAAKEALAVVIKVISEGIFENIIINKVGGPNMTEKEAAKVKEQLDKIAARLLSKLQPAG